MRVSDMRAMAVGIWGRLKEATWRGRGKAELRSPEAEPLTYVDITLKTTPGLPSPILKVKEIILNDMWTATGVGLQLKSSMLENGIPQITIRYLAIARHDTQLLLDKITQVEHVEEASEVIS